MNEWRMLRRAGWLAAMMAGLCPLLDAPAVHAQSESLAPGRIFSVEPVADGLGAFALVSGALLLDLNKHRWSGTSPCDSERRAPTEADRTAYANMPPAAGLCDRSEVPLIDRWVIEQDSKSAALLSDTLLLSLVLSPMVFSTIDTPAANVDAARLGDDTAVTFQTLGATYLATLVIKMAVARPRPLTYNGTFDKAERFSGSARLSFPSGHASLAFASASVLAVMLSQRFDDHPGAVLGIAGAYLAAGTTATARVLAGKHFLTDVIAGAVLGTVMGLTIPLLHTKTREPRVTAGQVRFDPVEARVGLSSRPVVGFGGVF